MKKYVKNKTVASQKVDEKELVLLHPKAENFFSLNTTAAFIWDMLEKPRTEEEIIAALANRYSGSGDSMKNDARNILKILIKWSLVDTIDGKTNR